MTSDDIEYRYKLTDRSAFEKLKPEDTEHTEIIIVKKGFVTDTSYANLAFFNGNEWHTPAQPLLKGVQREHLLKLGMIREREIREKDLKNYKTVRLINAMLDFEEYQLELDMKIIENS
nr:aminotransferase class IV [Bacteroidetes bacterium endosymbiont of Geopemphigus sp.]